MPYIGILNTQIKRLDEPVSTHFLSEKNLWYLHLFLVKNVDVRSMEQAELFFYKEIDFKIGLICVFVPNK